MHISRADGIRFLVPNGDDGYRSIVGKVLRKNPIWPENAPPYIDFEVGVSFGIDGPPSPERGYVDEGYVSYGYLEGDAEVADMTFEIAADPIRKPVSVDNLRGLYGLLGVRSGGMAGEQLAYANALAGEGLDIRQAPSECPTWVQVRMRPLPTYDTFIREIDVVGVLSRSAQGVVI